MADNANCDRLPMGSVYSVFLNDTPFFALLPTKINQVCCANTLFLIRYPSELCRSQIALNSENTRYFFSMLVWDLTDAHGEKGVAG